MCIRWFLATLFLLAAPLRAEITWPPALYDPAAETQEAADLILPLPCGGAMAFQRVAVPVDAENPLDDRAFRMGQSEANTGFSDYLTPTHLRGAFTDPVAGGSYYFIARYELTQGQYRALTGDCDAEFGPRDRFAQGALSWFDALDLTRRYSEWLLANAPDALPAQGDRTGFLRLPTEAEWEFAARGGTRIDPTGFPARRFFSDGPLGDYAHYQAPGQGRGKLRPVGLRKPNPLGLYDIYGNAEELALEPYRLNAIGRAHGQAGGLVTRGASIDAEEPQIYTAQRREYPMYNPRTGQALAGKFFGMRPVISSHIISDAGFEAIRSGWIDQADAQPEDGSSDPLAALTQLLEQEVDPRRKQALSDLQLEFRVAQDQAQSSLRQATMSTLLSGAAFVDTLSAGNREIRQLDSAVRSLRDRVAVSVGPQRQQLLASFRANVGKLNDLREAQDKTLLSYRTTLETLTNDVGPELRERAFLDLSQNLGLSEQADLLATLNRFWDDLATYQERPDMEQTDLLTLAIR